MKAAGKINILQIIPTPRWGGGEQYIYDLSRALIRYPSEKEAIFSVCFAGRESPAIREHFSGAGTFVPMRLSSMLDLGTVVKLGQLIRRENIGIVHAHIFKDAYMALFAKKIFGLDCKVIMTRHLARRGKFSFLYRWLYRQLDALIFVSQSARNTFLEKAPGNFRNRKLFPVVPLAVSRNRLRDCSPRELERIRKESGAPEGSFICSYCGRIAPEKGIDLMLGAMEELYRRFAAEGKPFPFYLLLVGTGEASYLQELAAGIKIPDVHRYIRFAGYIKDISPYISISDIGVFPSRVPEAFGLSALEYMSLGKPVIVSRLGSQQEIVRHEVCGLHTTLSREELAGSIYKLFSSPSLAETYGRNARRESLKYDYDNHLRQLTDIYQISEIYRSKT